MPYIIVANNGKTAYCAWVNVVFFCVKSIKTPKNPMNMPIKLNKLVLYFNQIIPTIRVNRGVSELITPLRLLSIRLAE